MSIPKVFFQTSKKPLEPYIIKMTKAMLPEDWTYRHFLDEDIVHFLKSHPLKEFPGSLDIFKSLKRGEHKADFFRYYFLFVKGGVFMDSDAMIYRPIDQIIKGYKFFSVKSGVVPDCIFQGILGAEPRNPLIGRALEFFFKGDFSALDSDYHFLCKDLYRLYNEVVQEIPGCQGQKENSDYHLLKESPDQGGDKIFDGQELSFRHFWRNKEQIPRTPGLQKSRNLVYCCVFYNKDYFRLLDLLLKSLKMYSSEGDFDFLVITQKQFEPLVKEIGRTLNLDLKIFCLDFSTIFQAACARLFIFDYPELDSYQKLLYIDTDILIKGSLDPVFQILDGAKDVLYGIESGTIESLNFGAQFFNFNQIEKTLTGLNSGTLLFLNSIQMKSLFQRIRGHLESFTQSAEKPPYCMDQPFINFHAIKDSLYDNKALNPFVSLFENNDTVDNYTTSSICHFSFPIGNFGHKYNRMCEFFHKTLHRKTSSDFLDLIGKKFSWNSGYIKFIINYEGLYKLETTWGQGSFRTISSNTVCAYWNNHFHILQFNLHFTEYISIRTDPRDFEFSRGSLIESYLNIYGDSHALLSFKNLQIDHRNLFQFSRTMFRIGRDNQIINFKPEHLSKDRIFCLAYGEVDVRGHVGKQVHYGRHHETVCKELVDAYFLTIQRNITEFKAIVIMAISPPTAMKDHEPCNIHSDVTGGPIPFVGTDTDRVIYRKRINELLEEGCSKFGYIFFNPYNPYTREDGTLKYELSDKCIHVGENKGILIEFQKLISSLA
jgi:lipopolysaccharide biosynthesis glycosyltransferase